MDHGPLDGNWDETFLEPDPWMEIGAWRNDSDLLMVLFLVGFYSFSEQCPDPEHPSVDPAQVKPKIAAFFQKFGSLILLFTALNSADKFLNEQQILWLNREGAFLLPF